MQSIVDFTEDAIQEIEIGSIIIRELKDGSYWLTNTDGQGMQVSEDVLEQELFTILDKIF